MSAPLLARPMRMVAALVLLLSWNDQAFGKTVPQSASQDSPLNVLFIMTDQHSERMMGCTDNGYGGVTTSMTPVLDQLADEGVRFDNAICPTPQCSPTRYSLINGMWPHSHGLRWNDIWEPRGLTTLPTLARNAGYVTATIGKHHFNWLRQEPRTEDFGFDLILDFQDYLRFIVTNAMMSSYHPANTIVMPGLPSALQHFTGFTQNSNEFHPAGYWADQTIAFLEERATDERPFLCYYSMYGPHTPLLPTGPASPQDWAHMYHPYTDLDLPPNLATPPESLRLAVQQNIFSAVTQDEWREILSYYYGLITQIDYNIGRVLQRLDELELAENTLVIYVSDHGEMGSEFGTWQKGGGNYDAVLKVPMILRLPGVIPVGQVRNELVNSLDLVPTILEMTGIPATDSQLAALDGRSLLDVMVGQTPIDWPTFSFSEFGMDLLPSVRTAQTVRSDQYKYSRDLFNGIFHEELYDISADPFETTNLINSSDPLIQSNLTKLRGELTDWWNDGIGHSPEYLVSGNYLAIPAASTTPFPALFASGVDRDVDLSWLPSSAAETQLVHFGKTPNLASPVAELGPMESTFNPGSLDANTRYYWRVDQVNANGVSIGPFWTFRTEAAGEGGPELPSQPHPPHKSVARALTAKLKWLPGRDTQVQRIYFGEAGQLRLVKRVRGNVEQYIPTGLEAGVTYEWRIDSVNADGTTQGTPWRFSTNESGLSRYAHTPSPAHMAELQPNDGLQLSWQQDPGAVTSRVYFGASRPLELVAETSGNTFDVGSLDPGEVYYWRVDTVNPRGVREGFTWRFRAAH